MVRMVRTALQLPPVEVPVEEVILGIAKHHPTLSMTALSRR